jgi:hypothetical protein
VNYREALMLDLSSADVSLSYLDSLPPLGLLFEAIDDTLLLPAS